MSYQKSTKDSIITVQNLSKSFHTLRAVDDISFSVNRGDLFAFLGQNGAGKSTTINILIGLLKRDEGKILWDNKENLSDFKENLGVVYQHNVLDDLLTARENLMLYGAFFTKNKKEQEERFKALVDLLHLESMLDKPVNELSGGQQRKVELARALWNKPKILFLDEPTTGLDPKTRIEVWELLHRIRKESKMTVFLTTHYMEETSDADQVVILHKGKIVAQGSPAELKGLYSHDRLVITPFDAEAFMMQLSEYDIDYERMADSFIIKQDLSTHAIELLDKLKPHIRFFEAVRGTMDDVFLQAAGEKLEGSINNETN